MSIKDGGPAFPRGAMDKVAEIEARHCKAETEDCYFIEAGSFEEKEKVFCDAKTIAHKDRAYLLKLIYALRSKGYRQGLIA